MKEQFKFQIGDVVQSNTFPNEEYGIVRRMYNVDSEALLYELTDGSVVYVHILESNFKLRALI